MASIRKLKNGSYEATIYCGRNADGTQIREYITMPTSKECKAAARDREIEIEENGLDNVGNMRFSAWAEKWLELRKSELAPSTYKSYKMYINHHFKPFFGDKKLSKINDLHIRSYLSEKALTIKPVTIRKHFFVLSNMLTMALKNKAPTRFIEPPKGENKKIRLPSISDFQLIFDAVYGHWDELPVLLAGWAGLREGEIFALKKDDIDWKNKRLRIDENKAASEDGYIFKEPKSEKGIREIVVENRIIELLKKKCAENTETMTIFNMRPDSYSSRFHNLLLLHNAEFDKCKKKGYKPPSGRTKKALINNITIQDKKIPIVRFHDLRHLHASDLFRAGVPDQYAADRLGHDIIVLKKIYQHLQLEDTKSIDDVVRKIHD